MRGFWVVNGLGSWNIIDWEELINKLHTDPDYCDPDYCVWLKRGHFAYAKPCGKAMDKSRKLDIDHSFPTLDHPLTTLRQVKFFRKLLTKNSATAIIFF